MTVSRDPNPQLVIVHNYQVASFLSFLANSFPLSVQESPMDSQCPGLNVNLYKLYSVLWGHFSCVSGAINCLFGFKLHRWHVWGLLMIGCQVGFLCWSLHFMIWSKETQTSDLIGISSHRSDLFQCASGGHGIAHLNLLGFFIHTWNPHFGV